MVKGAVWFRTDLRLDDNPALNSAMEKCGQIIGIYLFSEVQWNLHNESNIKPVSYTHLTLPTILLV